MGETPDQTQRALKEAKKKKDEKLLD